MAGQRKYEEGNLIIDGLGELEKKGYILQIRTMWTFSHEYFYMHTYSILQNALYDLLSYNNVFYHNLHTFGPGVIHAPSNNRVGLGYPAELTWTLTTLYMRNFARDRHQWTEPVQLVFNLRL